jgi:hypothetical protein
MVKKYDRKVYIGFIWLRIETISGLLQTQF